MLVTSINDTIYVIFAHHLIHKPLCYSIHVKVIRSSILYDIISIRLKNNKLFYMCRPLATEILVSHLKYCHIYPEHGKLPAHSTAFPIRLTGTEITSRPVAHGD